MLKKGSRNYCRTIKHIYYSIRHIFMDTLFPFISTFIHLELTGNILIEIFIQNLRQTQFVAIKNDLYIT